MQIFSGLRKTCTFNQTGQISQDRQLHVSMDACLHFADVNQWSVLISTAVNSFYQTWERFARCLLKGQRRNCLWENLKTAERKFPPSFSTAFIPACASYFLSSSACFLLCYSYCSSISIVPSLLKRDIVHCGETSSLSSVTQEFPHRRKTQPEVYLANNTYFIVKIFS